ncbi:hypothetical protein MXB_165 [Myxobolus squamalis]|nr:hypothetical protein MXB_165 [Myxobolus squamalis]
MSDEGSILQKRKFLSEKDVLELNETRKEEWCSGGEKQEMYVEKPDRVKTLFEQLETNRNKMIDDFEEHFKLKNHVYKGLTEEEMDFMIKLKQFKHKKANEIEENVQLELIDFRSKVSQSKSAPEIVEKNVNFCVEPLKELYKPKPNKLVKLSTKNIHEQEAVQIPKSETRPSKQSHLVMYSESSDSD